jgi:hypothetical protein
MNKRALGASAMRRNERKGTITVSHAICMRKLSAFCNSMALTSEIFMP